MDKAMEFLCMSIYVGVVTYCFSALELRRIVFDRKFKKTTNSAIDGDRIISLQKPYLEKVEYPENCTKGHNARHEDHCTVAFGNKKTAFLVQNLCIENSTVLKGITGKEPKSIHSASGGFIVVYNASNNFSEWLHHMDVTFTTHLIPAGNTFSSRPSVIFMPKIRKVLENLHHLINDFALGLFLLMSTFQSSFPGTVR